MSAGLEVYTSSGVLQITEQFRNLQFKSKGSIYMSDTSAYVAVGGDTDDVFAFTATHPTTTPQIMMYTFVNNGTLYVSFNGFRFSTVTYYRFGKPSLVSGSYFEVYNASGELVFTDNAKFMKPLGMASGQWSGSSYTVDTITFDSSKSTAVIRGAEPMIEATQGYSDLGEDFKFYSSYIELWSPVLSSDVTWSKVKPYYHFMIVDVTGY